MTPDELRDVVHNLMDADRKILRQLKRRPRAAAKTLCNEFKLLGVNHDLWKHIEDAAGNVERYEKEANELIRNIRALLREEAKILAQLGVDQAEIGEVLTQVYGGFDIVSAIDGQAVRPAIDNLKDRLKTATELLCGVSRGPLLGALDFVLSAKGAAVIGAVGLGAANLWHAVTVDGGAVSSASFKVAIAVANRDLGAIADILGKG